MPPILPAARKNGRAREPRILLEYAKKNDGGTFAQKYGHTP
jgi:hypothetical protein